MVGQQNAEKIGMLIIMDRVMSKKWGGQSEEVMMKAVRAIHAPANLTMDDRVFYHLKHKCEGNH